jgi:hypothetical protein
MDAKSVGFLVFGLVMGVVGYIPYRFPRAFYKRYSWNLEKPLPAWVPPYNRAFGVGLMIAGSTLAGAGILVIR